MCKFIGNTILFVNKTYKTNFTYQEHLLCNKVLPLPKINHYNKTNKIDINKNLQNPL